MEYGNLRTTIESYKPLDKVKAFHCSRSRVRCLFGGYGAGKTVAGIWDDIDDLMNYPGMELFLGRKFREDIKISGSVWETFYRECPPELIERTEDGGWTVWMRGGSKVTFGGLYTRQRQRLRVPVCGKIHIDEGAEINDDDLNILTGRLRGTGPRTLIFSTNPPNEDHWMHRKFVTEKANDYELFKLSIYDNEHLPEDYIRNMENEYRDNPSYFKKYIMGDFGFITAGQPVFVGFKDTLHVADLTFNPYKPILRCWDWGWSHPCVSFCQWDDKERFLILKTEMGNKIYLEDWAPHIIKISNEEFSGCTFSDFCDIAGKHKTDTSKLTSIQTLSGPPYNLKLRYKMVTDVMKPVTMMQRMMSTLVDGKPKLMVDRQNKLMQEALSGGYCYGKLADGRTTETPADDGWFENVIDSVKYIIWNLYNPNADKARGIKIPEASFSRVGYGMRAYN